jgi:hypothetical protein
MTALELYGGQRALVDPDDLERTRRRKWHVGSGGYVRSTRWVLGGGGAVETTLLHRFVLDAPAGAIVDHINGDKLDNRRENLRIVTAQVNQANRKRLNRNNTSGARGVVRRNGLRKPWRAQLYASGRVVHLGYFATRDEAVAARHAGELEHYGEVCP